MRDSGHGTGFCGLEMQGRSKIVWNPGMSAVRISMCASNLNLTQMRGVIFVLNINNYVRFKNFFTSLCAEWGHQT